MRAEDTTTRLLWGAPQISRSGVILSRVQSTKRWLLAVVLLGIAAATVAPFVSRGTRGVRLAAEGSRSPSTHFDRSQSAALFVGVREFTDDVERVPFAVDDAVDLAYVFAFDRRVCLVPPRRVVLVLSGRVPVKPESREHLRALREAGADIRFRAEAADILAALREQTARAGREGLLIVSIAAHGFLRDGHGYILGASSRLRDPATMLAATEMFETMADTKAQRSVVFLDACRERMVKGKRSVLASAMSVAPRITHANGQAVFYAAAPGQPAYDDFDARNGVFTKSVIDGIKCGAAKVRGAVTAETLARYVEMNVHTWIRVNRDPDVGSATQFSMDGEARNIPLAQCVFIPTSPLRVTAEGTAIRAYSEKNEPLWQHDAGGVVMGVETTDLDADGTREVVFATPDAVAALDDGGKPLWSARENMKLSSFLTCDLRRQRTYEVIALWNGGHASRLALYGSNGARLGAYDSSRRLEHFTIGRPTNYHNPKIVATAGNTLLLFDRKKLAAGKALWSGRITRGTIASVAIVDGNGDGRSDIAVTTSSGAKIVIDFDGHVLRSQGAHFERLSLTNRDARSHRRSPPLRDR